MENNTDSSKTIMLDSYIQVPFSIKPEGLDKDPNIYTTPNFKILPLKRSFAEELHSTFKVVNTPLGPFSIVIENSIKDGESHLLGSMDMDSRTIHLSSDTSCSGSQKETFIHELVHLALELGGYLEDKDEEKVESTVEKTTTQASRGLTYLINMNPNLFIFLANKEFLNVG